MCGNALLANMHVHLYAAAGLPEMPLWCPSLMGTAVIAAAGTRTPAECCRCLVLAANAALRGWRRVSAGSERH